MRIFLVAATSFAAIMAGEASYADETPRPTAHLVFSAASAPATCPTAEALQSTVAARLGYDPFRPEATRAIEATIRKNGTALVAEIVVHDPATRTAGKRRLSSASGDCVELGSAMGFALSVAIDPTSAMRPANAAPHPSPPTTAPPAPALPPTDASVPAPPLAPAKDIATAPSVPPSTSPAMAVRLGAGGSVAVGATPNASFAPSLLVGLGYGRASVDLEGRGHLPSSAEASPSGAVTASLLVASVVPCLHVRFAIGCLSGGVGRLSASGHGVDLPARAFATYAEVGARLGFELPLTSALVARLTADALVPLTTTTLRLRDAEIASTSPVVAALGAGLVGHVR